MEHLSGKFLVLDGGEGCGKSTQCRLLADALTKDGEEVLAVRDPGTTALGENIRALLLDPNSSDMGMRCEMLLYMAARAQLMRELVLPALEAGKCVISDRFISSTLAYQLDGDQLSFEQIVAVGGIAVAERWPDLTIILDIPLEASSQRISRTRDRIEMRSDAYHQKVRMNYLGQAKQLPARYRVIRADQSIAAVHQDVLTTIQEFWRA